MRIGKLIGKVALVVGLVGALTLERAGAAPVVGFTNMETNGAPSRHTFGSVPVSTTPLAGRGNFRSAGEYGSQADSGKNYTTNNSEGSNDAFGDFDGAGTYTDVCYVITAFGEWPVYEGGNPFFPDKVNLIAGFRLNGIRSDNSTPGDPSDDFFTDQNFAFITAKSYNTQIPSSTNGLAMNLYIVTNANLGLALRTSSSPHYSPHQGTLGAQTRKTNIQITWDVFQGGRHSGAFGDFYTVSPPPDVTVSTSDIVLGMGAATYNLSVGNTGPNSHRASILTAVACLYNDADSAFTIENHLGETWSGGIGAEILPITNGEVRANAVVVRLAHPGKKSTAKLDLYFNDPDAAQTVQTINLVALPPAGITILLR